MKRIVAITTVFCLLALANLAQAQTGKIKGFVYDKESGEPVLFTNVTIQGTTLGAATDVNGYYNIVDLPEGNYEARATKPHTYLPTLIENIVIDENGAIVDFALEPCSKIGFPEPLKLRHHIHY